MTNIEGKTANIGFFEQVGRKLATGTLSHTILRSETTDTNHNIDRAKELLRAGNGLIVVINHFSIKDPPLAANEVFHHREMGNKRLIAPIAYHMDSPWYHSLGKLIGFSLAPIVTENTVRVGKNGGLAQGEGTNSYVAKSLDLLRDGGVVILAPQGSRKGHLGQPERTVSMLMLTAKRKKIENISLLFLGFGIRGVDDYSDKKVRGFNPFKKYDINVGACLTKEELIGKAAGDFRNVDKVVFEELRKVVPPNYR